MIIAIHLILVLLLSWLAWKCEKKFKLQDVEMSKLHNRFNDFYNKYLSTNIQDELSLKLDELKSRVNRLETQHYAIEERIEQKSNIEQHKNRDEGGKTTKTSDSHCSKQSRKKQKKA